MSADHGHGGHGGGHGGGGGGFGKVMGLVALGVLIWLIGPERIVKIFENIKIVNANTESSWTPRPTTDQSVRQTNPTRFEWIMSANPTGGEFGKVPAGWAYKVMLLNNEFRRDVEVVADNGKTLPLQGVGPVRFQLRGYPAGSVLCVVTRQ